MSLRKKVLFRFKWMIGIGVMLLSILAIVITILRKKEVYYYLAYPNTYYFATDDAKIKIKLYSSQEKDPYLQKTNITNLSLEVPREKDHYALSIDQIVAEEEHMDYQKHKYRAYTLYLNFPFENGGELQMYDVNLVFEFVYGESFKIPIGSFIFYEKSEQNALRLSHLKGTIEEKSEMQILTGVGMTLYHIENHSFQLEKVEPLDKRITIDSNDILELHTTTYSQTTPLQEMKQKFCKQTFQFPFIIDSSSQVHLFFPLDYHDLQTITTLAFVLTYQEDGVIYTQVLEPFQFFKTTSVTYYQVKYVPNSN